MKKLNKKLLIIPLLAVIAAGGIFLYQITDPFSDGTKTAKVGDYKYRYGADLTFEDTEVVASVKVKSANGNAIPGGNIGMQARLYNQSLQLVGASVFYYTKEEVLEFNMLASASGSEASTYYAQGVVDLYNNYTGLYTTNYTDYVTNGTASIGKDDVPYGSGLVVDDDSELPDMISAVGVNGVGGYIRNEELLGNFTLFKDADLYTEVSENGMYLPVYDLDTNVVDVFFVSYSFGDIIYESED